MTHLSSVWCSKYHFFFMISSKILWKNGFNVFFFQFTKTKSFECPKIMLGTSDTWWTSHLSQQPSKPAYHIVDCGILTIPSDGPRKFQVLSTKLPFPMSNFYNSCIFPITHPSSTLYSTYSFCKAPFYPKTSLPLPFGLPTHTPNPSPPKSTPSLFFTYSCLNPFP